MAVNATNKYADMSVEQIATIRRRIETFAKDNEFFDSLCNHVEWDRGSKTYKTRRVIHPRIKAGDVKKRTEDIAPRPTKIAIASFTRSVDIYSDKVPYTAEDVLFGYDDIVGIAGDTLASTTTQKLDFIKGKPFISSAATITAEQSSGTDNFLLTQTKAGIILSKNKALKWSNGKYLCLATPEELEKLKTELEAKGTSLSEPTKAMIDEGVIGHYGKFMYKECSHDLMYKDSTEQYLVFMGRRHDGSSPVDVSKIKGEDIEIINNKLGSGVLLDEDGNYTSDDNNQRGSVAVNVNGLGACVNDDLCILNCAFDCTTVAGTMYEEGGTLDVTDLTNYEAFSPTIIAAGSITKTAGTNTTITIDGIVAQGSLLKCTVAAGAGHTLASTNKWTTASFVGVEVIQGTKDDAVIWVRVLPSATAITLVTANAAS